MNKKEFQQKFKFLIDGIIDELPMPHKLDKFARKFAKAPETLQKWYDGVSAPANASRDIVVKHLYAEQKKREIMDIVRHVIQNELKIKVVQDSYTPVYEGDTPSFHIQLKLEDKIIHTEYVSLNIFSN